MKRYWHTDDHLNWIVTDELTELKSKYRYYGTKRLIQNKINKLKKIHS